MNFWTDCLTLDASPEAVLTLFDHYGGRRRGALRRLAGGLESSGASELAARVIRLLDLAPGVLESSAAWLWNQAVLRAASRNDLDAFRDLERRFARFEAAGAVLSHTDWHGTWPFTSAVVLPGSGVLVDNPRLTVESGKPSTRAGVLPRSRGILVDAHDLSLRGTSANRFRFVDADGGARTSAELDAALDLADAVAPTLAARLSTTIVPVHAAEGWVEAATDEQTPGVTYCSFGRSPADLLAALAHEESHAVLNAATLSIGLVLPFGDGAMDVPWKPEPRRLPAVLHGLAAFARAATIRQRAGSVAMLDAGERQQGELESSWVQNVSARLLGGALGPLPPELVAWVEANLTCLGSSPAARPRPELAVTAQSTSAFPFRWWLLRGGASVDAAAAAYSALQNASWHRHVTDITTQDALNLSAADDSSINHFFGSVLPAALHRLGVEAHLHDVVAHRMRAGDRIDAHNDAGQAHASIRAVLGVTPGQLTGGRLSLWGHAGSPTLSVLPAFGDVLVMELGADSFHEVETVRDERARLTAVGSYLCDPVE